MSRGAIAILTTESKQLILGHGGSQAWVLNRARTRSMPYVVCVRNARNAGKDSGEPHGTAFLVGRIGGIVPMPESEGREGDTAERWKVVIREYAEVDVPDAWGPSRNPVRYTTLEEMGIDPLGLDFKPMPSTPAAPTKLTIQQAKEALALSLGVRPEDIEITIRA